MDPVVVVVGNGIGNTNIELVNVLVMCQWAKFFLHGLNTAFHEAVLSWASWFAGAQCNPKPRAGTGVTFTQVFTTTVTVQNGRALVGT